MDVRRDRITRDEGTVRDRFLQFPWEMMIFVAVVVGLTYFLQR